VTGGVVPLLKALAGPDDILGTQHRNSPTEIIALGYSNIQARDVPFEDNKVGTRSSKPAMKIVAQRQASGTASQAA
jgi:hypothetical protein